MSPRLPDFYRSPDPPEDDDEPAAIDDREPDYYDDPDDWLPDDVHVYPIRGRDND